jgi:hypothetical protein
VGYDPTGQPFGGVGSPGARRLAAEVPGAAPGTCPG